MNRRSKTIEQCNRAIYAEFTAHIRNDTPVMLAYAYCAKCHDLGEDPSVRSSRSKPRNNTTKEGVSAWHTLSV